MISLFAIAGANPAPAVESQMLDALAQRTRTEMVRDVMTFEPGVDAEARLAQAIKALNKAQTTIEDDAG
jgi:hypothetical protein